MLEHFPTTSFLFQAEKGCGWGRPSRLQLSYCHNSVANLIWYLPLVIFYWWPLRTKTGSSEIIKGVIFVALKEPCNCVQSSRICVKRLCWRYSSRVWRTQLWLVLKSLGDVQNAIAQVQKWCTLSGTAFSLCARVARSSSLLERGACFLPQSRLSRREGGACR